ncbi:hypothetical protein R8Z50_22875 [Longispora sp. K20-0274]|uniref:hypothetical protein n=1 Tax=Longispora sp. K20-0274 TaxID=3088255 RepID=UPI00399AB513
MARRHRIGLQTLTSRHRPPAAAPDPTAPQESGVAAIDGAIYRRDADGTVVGYIDDVAFYGQQGDFGMWYVFAGEWRLYQDGHDLERAHVGYLGQITSLVDGWAAFRTTRRVLDDIVADHAAEREALRARFAGNGLCAHKVEAAVDLYRCRLDLHGDVLVWDDQAGTGGDPTSVAHIRPDADGLYDLTVLDWCWMPVHPQACDRVVCDIPPPTTA